MQPCAGPRQVRLPAVGSQDHFYPERLRMLAHAPLCEPAMGTADPVGPRLLDLAWAACRLRAECTDRMPQRVSRDVLLAALRAFARVVPLGCVGNVGGSLHHPRVGDRRARLRRPPGLLADPAAQAVDGRCGPICFPPGVVVVDRLVRREIVAAGTPRRSRSGSRTRSHSRSRAGHAPVRSGPGQPRRGRPATPTGPARSAPTGHRTDQCDMYVDWSRRRSIAGDPSKSVGS